jgi:hypothetical protein
MKRFIIALVALMGCGSGSEKSPPKASAPAPKIVRTAEAGPGQSERFSAQGKREKLWTIRWKKAQLDFAAKDDYGGMLETVEGTFFRAGKEASRFRAQFGEADKRAETLLLRGDVVVVGRDPAVTLRAQRLEWDALRGIVKARQDVTIQGEFGSMGPFKELWATPELDHIATPAKFVP